MSTRCQIALGIVATVVLAVLDEVSPGGGTPLVIVMAVFAAVAAVRGPRLPLYFRVFVTATTFYFGYIMCLVGRTTEPRFSMHTLSGIFLIFGLYAFLPTLALLRLWRGRMRVAVVASVFPVSLAIASTVAAYEEDQFIQMHRNGIGPTARWTVSNHWLAYNAQSQQLWGGD